jgi:tRNA (Thr-GGU) A37 N-methylase
MFTPHAIGFVDSPYKDPAAISKGLGTKHDAEGILRILPEFELGLTDIEGFSHLMVIWAFDSSHGSDLIGMPPSDNRSHGYLPLDRRAVQTRSALPSSNCFAV